MDVAKPQRISCSMPVMIEPSPPVPRPLRPQSPRPAAPPSNSYLEVAVDGKGQAPDWLA